MPYDLDSDYWHSEDTFDIKDLTDYHNGLLTAEQVQYNFLARKVTKN